MIRKWLTLAGLVLCSCLGNSLAPAAADDVTVTTSRRVHPVLIRNEHNILLRIVMDVQHEKEVRLTAMHSLLRFDYSEAGKQQHVLLIANPHSQMGRTHQTIQVTTKRSQTPDDEWFEIARVAFLM